jgi:predicted  nucleic acid-binding Zn-ribbon protein
MMKKKSKLESEIDWLKNEIERDSKDLNFEKNNFINKIKELKKEDILPKKPKKLTLWEKLKKILMIS